MPAGIEAQLRKSGLSNKDVSIYIKEVGADGGVLASHLATQSRVPASVCKVLSTYASVLELGFDYRWPTQFYMSGVLNKGVLNGDLIVKGYGDPTLSLRDLDSIVQSIRKKGIRRISGNIVIDRSYFDVGSKDNSGFDKNLYSPYNAMPDAMMFNERISTVCVTPRKNEVRQKTVDGSYKLVNKLQRVNQPCSGRYSWPAVTVNKNSNIPVVSLYGPISQNCGTSNICQVITKPYLSFYYALKDRLNTKGVKVDGAMRLRKVPGNAKILFTHYSKTLEQIISKTAKESNNLYARHLMLLLGAKMYGEPSRLSKGRKAVLDILEKNGAYSEGVKIDNGCGLSRTSRITAKALGDMYDNAYTRYGKRWMNTLSIAGVDGTIKRRFAGSVVKNRAWMKTGTVNGVKNIGGYVQSKSGQLYTVVILVESKATWKGAQLQNDIIKWLVDYRGGGVQQKRQTSVPSRSAENRTPQIYKEQSASTHERYYVQAGSFTQSPKKDYLLRIEHLGLPYKVQYSDKYKVLIGAYENENTAKKALEKVRKHINSNAFITKL